MQHAELPETSDEQKTSSQTGKLCVRCKRLKPIAQFCKRTAAKDGLSSWCRLCYREHRQKTKEKYRERCRLYNERNKERRLERLKRWKENNPERSKQYVIEWRRRNVERHRVNKAAGERARTSAKLKSTPVWADLSEIRRFYELASEMTAKTGVSHHVDHIVPLRSRLVCGFHSQDNLQVIPANDNVKKGNRWWPDMP